MTVARGTASATSVGPDLHVTASHNAILNWQTFNIGPGETTTFHQPSAASVVWNRINDPNPSQIWGRLSANGVVVLMNQAGFYFGPGSMVNVAGLVVTTGAGAPTDFGTGGAWQFTGPPPLASIINYGAIQVGSGGSAFLIAERVENHGSITAPEGSIGLVAGQEVLLSDRPDGRGLSVRVRLPKGSVDNTGRLSADAGTIALHAQVVNQNGLIQADSVRERNGVIELFAAERLALGEESVLQATGGSSGVSAGGHVSLQSAGSFTDSTSSRIRVVGGGLGGDGGEVAVSAPLMGAIHSQIDGQAGPGGVGGRLIIDPTDIVLSTAGNGSLGNGTVNPNDPPDVLHLDVDSAFTGFSQIHLQATRNITLAAGTLWDLEQSTGVSDPGSRLTLEAGNDISLENGSSVRAGAGWSVSWAAGRDFGSPGTVQSGRGSILFQGSASLEAQDGSVELLAGQDIRVNGGFVRTIGGGSIEATALAGDVDTGNRARGFNFLSGGLGYAVDPDLGGISTANGGDVALTAGRDIISYQPPQRTSSQEGGQTDAGSGAFGAAAGNVTLTASRNVAGHFVVRNGDGRITTGQDAGTRERMLSLSVVRGGWEVRAGRDILLQEVRNPNGVFNQMGFSASTTRHAFDYAPDAYTILNAGHGIQLLGAALPRNSSPFEQAIAPLYPPRLEIEAGAGGVALGTDVRLFPSPRGHLRILTTDGGDLFGTRAGDLVQLIMSDSSRSRYTSPADFGLFDHAEIPLHLEDPNPVQITVAGDMMNVLIGTPKATEIIVGGNMINSRFEGQNLHPDDVSSIVVSGDIFNRNVFTRVQVATAPDFNLFQRIFPPLSGNLQGLDTLFVYDPSSRALIFQGRMRGDQLQALLNLQVMQVDRDGVPVLDPDGNPVIVAGEFVAPVVLQQLYADSQDVPLNPDTGYRLGGPGLFRIEAHHLDLGATLGIVSQGPRANAALAQFFTRGADIQVNLRGDLDMFSTTISSLNGGNLDIVSAGSVRVGSSGLAGNDLVARGIFTVDPSDIRVIARGDIDINGSRIAAYDGGDVTVRSLEGDVNAGTGGLGSVSVEKIYVDPITREVLTYAPTIPGSGILATSFPRSLDPAFPPSQSTVGDILVETPQGDIVASSGGIVQLPLNGVNTAAGQVRLRAGSVDENGEVINGPNGQPRFVGNIDASGSGVIGGSVELFASGEIKGLVFARRNIDISARQNVSVTALAQGSVSVDTAGSVSGTLIGVGSVTASGATVDAALLSQHVTASGELSSSQVGFAQASAASSTSQALQSEDSATAGAKQKTEDDESLKKKSAATPRLARTAGRVTVILPKS